MRREWEAAPINLQEPGNTSVVGSSTKFASENRPTTGEATPFAGAKMNSHHMRDFVRCHGRTIHDTPKHSQICNHLATGTPLPIRQGQVTLMMGVSDDVIFFFFHRSTHISCRDVCRDRVGQVSLGVGRVPHQILYVFVIPDK